MLFPVAIEIGDDQTAFGVVVPDLEGCYSAGDSYKEALDNAREVIRLCLDRLAEEGRPPPQPGDVGRLMRDPDYAGWAWTLVEVDVPAQG